ncbi:MAG: Rne/Rng family ribonuclease, partial [Deltaproteobacteria bacterium]
ILRMSELGLIEMTRKRTRENLNRLMSEPCNYCEGRGTLKSKKTICCEIFRDLEREAASSVDGGNIYVRVNPEIDHVLKEEEQQSIMDMEKRIDRPIIIIAKEDFHMEQYEIST